MAEEDDQTTPGTEGTQAPKKPRNYLTDPLPGPFEVGYLGKARETTPNHWLRGVESMVKRSPAQKKADRQIAEARGFLERGPREEFYPPLRESVPQTAVPLDTPRAQDAASQRRESPDIYSASPAAPQGWQPSPQEIKRLVKEEGLLTAEQAAKDPNLIWRAGRASLARRQSFAWFDKKAGEAAVQDILRGESMIQKAMWQQVPANMRQVRGDTPIDTAGMYRDTLQIHRGLLFEELREEGKAATPEALAKLEEEAEKNTLRSMSSFMNSGSRLMWIDAFDRDITQEIMDSNAIMRIWRVLTQPTRYGAIGRRFPDTTQGNIARSQMYFSPGQLKSEGILSKFGRFAPSTLLSPLIFGGHDYMSEEYIEAIRAGDDITFHIGDLARRIGGVEAGESTSTTSKVLAAVGIGGIILFEPDLASLILLPWGAVAKGTRIANGARKARKAAKTIRRLKKTLGAGGADISRIAQKLNEYDEAVMRAVELRAVAELGTSPFTRVTGAGGGKAAEGLFQRTSAFIEEADRLRKQAGTLRESSDSAESLALAAQKEYRAAEADLVAAYIWRESSEAQKNTFLTMHGLSEEDAAKILFREDVPISEAGAKKVEQIAKDARKEAKAIRKDPSTKKLLKTFDKKARELGAEFNSLTSGFFGLPEATTAGGKKLRTGWDVLSRVSDTTPGMGVEELFAVPTYGQLIRVPTPAGGTRLAEVKRVRIRGPKNARLSKGNDNQIVVVLSDGEEFTHPYRVSNSTATHLRSLITQFEETYEIVAANGGVLERLIDLENTAKMSDDYASALRLQGPTAKKVQEFQEAGEALAAASGRYAERAAEAGLQERSLEKIRKSFGKKGAELSRAEIRAHEVGRIRQVYMEAMGDVARGLDNFVDVGLKNLGVVGFKSLKQFKESMKAIGRADSDAIKNFGQKVNEIRVEEIYRDIGKKSWKFKAATKTRKNAVVEFNVETLLDDLITHLGGAERTQEFLASQAGSSIRELVSWAEEGIKIGKKPIVGIKAPKAALVQEEVKNAIRVGEATRLFTEDVVWGRAVHEAWRDLGLINKASRNKRLLSKIRKFIPRYKGAFKNVKYRAGEFSTEMEDALIETERLLARGQLELLEVGRLEEFGTTPAERFASWLDYQGDVKLKEGTAQWGVASGNGTPYQKGSLQIGADLRSDPRLAEEILRHQEKATEDLRKSLVLRLRKAIGDKLDGSELGEEFIEMAAQAAEDITPDLVHFLGKGEDAFSGAPLGLVSVSHMWLPRTMAADVAPKDGILLMGLAKMFLRQSNTFGPSLNGLGEVIDAGFSSKMRRATYAILGDIETNASRANAFASSGFMAAATMGTLGDRVVRASGLAISAETAADVNRIFMGEWDEVKDLNGAMDALNRMGMPFTQKDIKTGREALPLVGRNVHMKSLVELGSVKGGSSMVPKIFIDALEAKVGRIAKELRVSQIAGRDLPAIAHNKALQTYLGLWRGSAVTGLLIPNPRYWTNNIFGDFSQLWQEAGFGTAARLSFINAPTNLPFYGRKLQEMNLYMAEKVAGKSGRGEALPGIIATFMNPHLGRIFKGEAGHFVTKNGEPVTFDQARRWALEDGISESFVREELISLHHRITEDMVSMGKEMGRWWQGQIYNHASLVQERQRVGFYLDQIQRGVPRKEAAKRTKRALYDWSHGIAEWEARTISRVVPFWRFWRLSMKQAEYSLIEPFVRPSGEYAKKALTGNTKLAQLRQQLLIWPSLPDFVYQENAHAGMTMDEKVDALARQLYPSWADTRPKLGVVPFDPIRRRNYLESTGRNMTHEMIILPQVTATDSMDMLFALWTGVGLTLNKVAETLRLPHMEFEHPGDVTARFFEPILGGTAPGFEYAARALLSVSNVDLDFEIRGSDRYLSPEEEKAWKLIPGLRGQLSFDEEVGRYKAPQKLHMLYRMLPVAPTQLQGWVGAFTSPEWDQGMKAGFISATQRLTGIGRRIPFNVNQQVDGRLRDVRKEFKEFMNSNSGVLNPYSGPRTKNLPRKRQEELRRRSRGYSEEED